MNNETYLDFCFIRERAGNFSTEINEIFTALFKGQRLKWYLEEKCADGAEIVIAEIKGMSRWHTEEEVLQHMETCAPNPFWNYLQGYHLAVYPERGCASCGKR